MGKIVIHINLEIKEKGVIMSEANPQTIADKKWQAKNHEYAKYLRDRPVARNFIKKKAMIKDLEEIENLKEERKNI